MIGLFDRLSRPLMRALDPEDAHALAIKALRYMPLSRAAPDAPALAVRAFGLNFPNPVGLAAGFDKNAQVPDALLRLGFGFVEVGTVTPRAQAGNPRPRLFRLETDGAVINRLGFNNEGAPAMLARLAARARAHEGGIVGVNIGANRDSADRAEDYVRLIESFAAVAGYFTVNVSSPNTPGLRDLQQASALDGLLARVIDARERVRPRAGPTPVLLKIAPDLTLSELDDVVGIARKHRVDGMIVGNTTIARPASLARARQGRRSGRAVGPAAVQAFDPRAGGNLRARRGRFPADRRRRHRLRARPRSPRSKPAPRWCSSIRPSCSAASRCCRRSRPIWRRRSSVDTATRSPPWSAWTPPR